MPVVTRYRYALLLSLMILEALLLLYFQPAGHLSYATNSFLYIGCSLAIGLVFMVFFYGKEVEINPGKGVPIKQLAISLPLSLLALVYVVYTFRTTLQQSGPGVGSDIIPTIQTAAQRLLDHIDVYKDEVVFSTHSLPVTYLPMQWLPYTISEAGHFDPRWITLGIWLGATFLISIYSYKKEPFVALLFLALLGYLLYMNRGILANTVELMVAAYYMFLVFALNRKSALLQGIAIGICLLSRFSLVLWLPLLGFTLFAANKKKELIVTASTALAFVVIFYIIPFLSKDWSSFSRGLDYYTYAAGGEWQKGYHLKAGTGLAFLISEKANGSIVDKIHLIQKIHLFGCLALTGLMGAWYWFNRHKIHYKIFLLASFKIYLTFFLAFIQVPYIYLMIVGNFVSIAIFVECARYRLARTN